MKFKIETRKTIALAFAGSLLILTGFAMYFKLDIPEPFKTLVVTVISFYFGKSTALDVPGQIKKDGE